MRILTLFALLLSLSACQDNQSPTTTAETTNESSADQSNSTDNEPSQESDTSKDHDFSLLADLPYEIIESDEVCESPVVMEFFAYQCPHCNTLEKFAAEWKSSNNGKVRFQPVPTHLGHQQFGSFLIIHHAAEKLGLLKTATPALFDRIHVDKKGFTSQDEAVQFLISLGVSEQEAKSTLEDEELIKTAIDEDFRLLSKYKVSGVPTILVNHRYKFNVTQAGGYESVFKLVDETLALPSNCSVK